MFELYYFHGATCGLKARLAFAEKGVDYKAHVVERADLRKSDYLALNRNGVVPTVVHDGNVLTESSVIINYLDDVGDGPSLKPDNPLGVAQMWWWMKRADECLPLIGITTYTISMRPQILKKSPEDLQAYIDTIPNAATRARRAKIIELGFDNPDLPGAIKGLDQMLGDMESALENNEWLAGKEYSLADTAMTPLIKRLDELECRGLWEETRPKLTDWWKRIKARPAYKACLGSTPNPEEPQHREAGKKAWPSVEKIWRS